MDRTLTRQGNQILHTYVVRLFKTILFHFSTIQFFRASVSASPFFARPQKAIPSFCKCEDRLTYPLNPPGIHIEEVCLLPYSMHAHSYNYSHIYSPFTHMPLSFHPHSCFSAPFHPFLRSVRAYSPVNLKISKHPRQHRLPNVHILRRHKKELSVPLITNTPR